MLAFGFRKDLPQELWMSTGAKVKHPFIPKHKILLTDDQAQSIIAFHALKGCCSVSQFAGNGKKTAWKLFTKEPNCAKEMGVTDVTD